MELWAALRRGADLSGFNLPKKGSRLSLSKFAAPAKPDGLPVAGVVWRSLDFSSASLKNLRPSDCTFADCVFDGAKCSEWEPEGCVFEDSSFAGADMRASGWGGPWRTRKRNRFIRCDFSDADFRESRFVPGADFVACRFAMARLDKIDFGGSTFDSCVFTGPLREVSFYDAVTPGEPKNEMRDVDFIDATFAGVSFKRLDLDSVKFPRTSDHLVLEPYKETLVAAIEEFGGRKSDRYAQAFAGFLGVMLRQAGAHQVRGVMNVNDIKPVIGPALADEFAAFVRKAGKKRS